MEKGDLFCQVVHFAKAIGKTTKEYNGETAR